MKTLDELKEMYPDISIIWLAKLLKGLEDEILIAYVLDLVRQYQATQLEQIIDFEGATEYDSENL